MRYFLLAILFVLGCKQGTQQPAAPPTASVSTAEAIAEDLPTYIVLPGTTGAVHSVVIQVRVEGWLEARHFEEGKIVQEGDLLYEIDSATYDAQLLQAKATLASAEAQAVFATKELNRNEPLFHSGAISQQSFDQLKTESEQAEAQVLAGVAGLELAELNVGYCSIYSPITGRIGKTNVDVGTLVGPTTNSELTQVIQISPMYVEFYPPANRLSMMQKSLRERQYMPIEMTITENDSEGQPSISSKTLTPRVVRGSLVFVDNEIQSTTSTFLARGEFINTTDILPGQYAEVRVRLQLEHDAIMIPTKAVMQQPGSYFVWTISDQNKAVITPVQLGSVLGQKQHVISGLEEGDAVIVEGTGNLRSGQAVTVSNGTPSK